MDNAFIISLISLSQSYFFFDTLLFYCCYGPGGPSFVTSVRAHSNENDAKENQITDMKQPIIYSALLHPHKKFILPGLHVPALPERQQLYLILYICELCVLAV